MRATKKALAVVLAVVMLSAFVPFAAQASPITISLDLPGVVETGETFDVAAGFTSNPGFISLRFTVSYHSSLELLSVSDGGICGDFLWSDDPTQGISSRASGVCSLVWSNPSADTDFTATGTFVTLRFRVKDNVAPGTLFVTLAGEEAWDHDLNAVTLPRVTGYTQILMSGDTYRLFVSESAENDTQRDGTQEHPYYYLLEALQRINTDRSVIGIRPIEVLLSGRVLDRSATTGQKLGGDSAPTLTLGGAELQVTIKSLYDDPDRYATLVHNYTGTGTVISLNNFYRFENLNFTGNGGGRDLYTMAHGFVVGPNCSFYTNSNSQMRIYGGGTGLNNTYQDPSIEVYSGTWDTVSPSFTYRGTTSGICRVIVGGDAVVSNLYLGMQGAGATSTDTTGPSTLVSSGSVTFDSVGVVTDNAVVTNLYGANSVAKTYTINSDLDLTISGDATVTNLYTLGNTGTINGNCTTRIDGGVVSNLFIGFKTPANGVLNGTSRVIFSGGVTRDAITVQSGMTGLYTVEAELNGGDVTVIPQIDFDMVKGSSGKLILGDPSWENYPVYSIAATEGSPRIKFNTNPALHQVLATLYAGATADSVHASTASGSASYRSEAGDPVPVIVGSGVGVIGNTLVLDSAFGIRYLFDRNAVEHSVTLTGTPFTVQYSLDGVQFTNAEVQLFRDSGVTYYSFLIEGISAKAIGDTITVTNSLSEAADQYSIKLACLDVIHAAHGTFSAEFVTLAKALLNYGRAAQLNFEYRTEDPILDAYYSGVGYNAITDQSSVGNRSGVLVNVRGTSLLLKDQVSLKFYFTVDDSLDPTALTARFSYKNVTRTSPLTASGTYYTASISLPAADLRELVTVCVTDASSNVISNTYADSVSSYCAYRLNTQNVQGTDRDMAEKLMAFVDAAIAYLNVKNPYSLEEDNLPPVFHR